jgi:hypothetical protein
MTEADINNADLPYNFISDYDKFLDKYRIIILWNNYQIVDDYNDYGFYGTSDEMHEMVGGWILENSKETNFIYKPTNCLDKNGKEVKIIASFTDNKHLKNLADAICFLEGFELAQS